MKLSDLTLEELKALVKGIVDDRLRELLGNPDLGMEMGEAIRYHVMLTTADRASRLRPLP